MRRGGTTLDFSSFPTVRPDRFRSFLFVAQTSWVRVDPRARRGARRVRRGGCDGSRVRGARRRQPVFQRQNQEGALVGYSESSVVLTDTDASDVPVWCVDADANCRSWAQAGECDANPGFMRASCMRSCDACAPRRAQRGDDDGPLVFLDVTIQHDADVARYADRVRSPPEARQTAAVASCFACSRTRTRRRPENFRQRVSERPGSGTRARRSTGSSRGS